MSGTTGSPPSFRIEERLEPDGSLRLSLIGELDLAVADGLALRLRELSSGGYHVRLDLAQLAFIDSTGLRELVHAVSESRRDSWSLEIGGELTDAVRRVIELTGTRSYLWPDPG
jgi:anti-anti-sigma factor